jgi:ubiquinone biosynthesis protein Coq4
LEQQFWSNFVIDHSTTTSPQGYYFRWQELRKAYQMFMVDTSQSILHILAAGQHSRWQSWVIARLRRQAHRIVDKEVTINLAALQQLSPDTLGGAYARHMIAHGFNAEAFASSERGSKFERRLGIAHDVQHIITGFDTSPIGEYGLAAFLLVQYGDLLNVFVLSWVPWSAISAPQRIPKLIKALWQGFMGGWYSAPLVTYPFEDNWEKPLMAVRQELRISIEL